MSRVQILRPSDTDRWRRALAECGGYDFYHLPEYHALAEARGEGRAKLFVYEAATGLVALPLLIREIGDIDGYAEAGAGWRDATSVYGYAGPATSVPASHEQDLRPAREALAQRLSEERIVSVFQRLHPLLEQEHVIAGLGDHGVAGRTVSLDLQVSAEEARRGYRKSHRYEIERARREGLACSVDEEGRYLEKFVESYRDSMVSRGAAAYYHFDPEYFRTLLASPALGMTLLVATSGERLAAGALFSRCGRVVQYHLACTVEEFSRLAPMKLLVDYAREWGAAGGAEVLHLGGGLGGVSDSLYRFKLGFGGREHEFRLWKWILNEDIYRQLTMIRRGEAGTRGSEVPGEGFFPAYRAPAKELGTR
ncbi:MAG: GNAT family N-acetyltransferase [Thermoanaerobaculia bacterium]